MAGGAQVFDVRMMRVLASFQGHGKDATCAAWHPCHEDLFASGAYDGTILFWLVSHPLGPQVRPSARILRALHAAAQAEVVGAAHGQCGSFLLALGLVRSALTHTRHLARVAEAVSSRLSSLLRDAFSNEAVSTGL